MCTKESQNHTQNFTRNFRNFTPVYRIIRQNSKFKCLKKLRTQELTVANCALRRTRA